MRSTGFLLKALHMPRRLLFRPSRHNWFQVKKSISYATRRLLLGKQGAIRESIEMLSKAPLMEKGAASARARLILAGFYLQSESLDQAMETLEKIDLAIR